MSRAQCSISNENITITASSPSAMSYTANSAQVIQTIGQFSSNSTSCTQADIVYQMTVTPTPNPSSLITFNTTTRVVSLYAQTNTIVGTYNVTITGKIIAAQIWTKSTSFQVTATGACIVSTEANSLTASVAPTAKTYIIPNVAGNVVVDAFNENSIYCTQADIFYSMTVTPPSQVINTTFITFNQATRQVTWSSINDNSKAGSYTITITGTIQAASTWTKNNSFTLIVALPCKDSTDSITITAGTAPIAQSYIVASSASSQTISQFSVQSVSCSAADIVYTMGVTPPNGINTSFITFDATNKKVNWSTIDNTKAGIYTITITGTIQAASAQTKSTQFQLTVIALCPYSSETITITAGTAPIAMKYIVKAVTGSQTISQFTENSTSCQQSDITYSMTVTAQNQSQSTTFITFSPSSRIVSFYTIDNIQAGTYTIIITGQITAVSIWKQSTQFTLTVEYSCSASTETITISLGTPQPDMMYTANDHPTFKEINPFSVNSNFCNQSNIKYSITVTPAPVPTESIRLDAYNNEIYVYGQTNTIVGTYNVTITGTITAAQTWSLSTSIQVTVTGACIVSTETDTLTASIAPSSQTYWVGASSGTVTIQQFTESSIYCSQSDIQYSMTVTSETNSESISFITFDPENRLVAWSTSNTQLGGNYIVTIFGTITTATIWKNTTQFTLNVIGCNNSPETITVTAGNTPTDQSYTVGSDQAFQIIEHFTQNSNVCTENDIIYSMTVKNQTEEIYTYWIGFYEEYEYREVYWIFFTNADIGTYTIIITGTISAAQPFSSSTQFQLTVEGSCIGSIETNSIVVSTSPSDQTYSLGASSVNVTIDQFTVSSKYCSQSNLEYFMTVTPSKADQSTQFITFDAINRVIAWSTIDSTLVGLYTLTVTGTISTTTIWSESTSFTLLVYNCKNSPESITISSVQPPVDQSYTVGVAPTTYTISEDQFTVESTICNQSDIIYYMSVTSLINGQTTDFISFDPTNREVAWQTDQNEQVGTYTIKITGIIFSVQDWSSATQFKLTVEGSCLYSTETDKLKASTSSSDQIYSLSTSQGSVTIEQFTELSIYCSQSDIEYSMTVTPQTAGKATEFITFDPASRVAAWFTRDSTLLGLYTLSITGTITTTTIWSKTIQFTLLVYNCSTSPETITISSESAPVDQSYKVGVASTSYTISQFKENSNACEQSDIVYQMSVTSLIDGQPTDFIIFDPTQRKVAWQTYSNLQVGTYTITINGTISAASTWTFLTSFKLTVDGSCYYTTEDVNLTATPPPIAQSYTVGSTSTILDIQPFTEFSKYCISADIVYSITVTPSLAGQATSFITFAATARKLSWYTNKNAQDGIYTINIIGKIDTQIKQWTDSISFDLTVSGICDYSTGYQIYAPVNSTNCTNSTNSAITQYIGQPKTYLKVGDFSQSDAFCDDKNITLNMIVIPTSPGQSNSFITYNQSTNIVNFQTNNKADAGVFNITVTASLNGVVYQPKNYTNFTLIVEIPDCSTTYEQINITAPQPPTRQLAYVTQPGGTLIQDFTEDSEYCTSKDINYNMLVNSDIAGQIIQFITFNPINKLVKWAPTKDFEIGNFTITIIAQLRSFNKTLSFKLEVKPQPPVNNPPVFSGLTNFSPSFSLSSFPESGSLNFGPLTDPDPGETVLLTYTITPSVGYTYFQIDPLTGVFSIIDKTGLVADSVSIYKIKITLQDSNSEQATRSNYIITFDVQNQKAEEITSSKQKQVEQISISSSSYSVNYKENTTATPPSWKSVAINNVGQVKILFSEKLIVPSNATVTINSTVLHVKLISPEADYLKYQKFQWSLIEFTPQQMTLQLVFENPLYISSLGQQKFDWIEVTCLNNSFFVSEKSYRPVEIGSSQKRFVPPQLSGGKGKTTQTLQSTLSDGSSGLVIGTLITNLLLSGSLTQLWGMLNSLQIIDHLTELNTFVPANVKDFYIFVQNLSSFKVIPTDKIFEWIGLSDLTSYNQFKSLGPLFLVLLVFVAILLILGLLEVLRRNFSYVSKSPLLCKLYIKMKNFIFWIATLRYLMESYVQLMQTSLTLAHSGFDWSNNLNRAQSVFSIFTLFICTVSPLAMTVFFSRRIKLFRDKNFLDRFSSVIGDLNWRYKFSSCFISLFCYRRMALVLITVFFGAYPYAQVQLTVVSCALAIIFFGYTDAYYLKDNRQQEFFNESTIMLCAYHYFLFTDFVDSPEHRYSLGYSLIATTGLNIGVNFIILLFGSLLNLMKVYKTLNHRYRVKQHIKKLQQKRVEAQKLKRHIQAQQAILQSKKVNNLKFSKYKKQEVLKVISEVASEKEQSDRSQQHRRAQNQRALQRPLQSGNVAIKQHKRTFKEDKRQKKQFKQKLDMSFCDEEQKEKPQQVQKALKPSVNNYDHQGYRIPSLLMPPQTSPPSKNGTQFKPNTSNILVGLTMPPEWNMSQEDENKLRSQIASQMKEYESAQKISKKV